MTSRVQRWASLVLLVSMAHVFAAERTFEFLENEKPAGFRSAVTGHGPAGNWKVVTEDIPSVAAPFSPKAPVISKRAVLGQISTDRDETRAPLFIYDGEMLNDFTFTTRFKIVSGQVEQMAGIAFRLQDETNYYYVRANAKDQNVAFLRYVGGELIGPISMPAEVRKGEWNQLAVECRGSKFRTLLNDREVIPWTEPNLVPFPDGSSRGVFPVGKVAFWTKADSVVYFTDAHLDFTPRELFAQTLVRETIHANPRLLGLKIFGLTTNDNGTKVIASNKEDEIGEPGDKLERQCIEKGGSYFGKNHHKALVTMPLRDRNGEIVGAVCLAMTTFLGQTEKNGLARALPIVKSMEARITSAKELLQ